MRSCSVAVPKREGHAGDVERIAEVADPAARRHAGHHGAARGAGPAAPLARAPLGPTQMATGHRRVVDRGGQLRPSAGATTVAPVEFICSTRACDPSVSARSMAREMPSAMGASMRPLTSNTSTGAGGRTGRRLGAGRAAVDREPRRAHRARRGRSLVCAPIGLRRGSVDLLEFFAAARLLVVAGKGGVGKTTVTAALASAAARAGPARRSWWRSRARAGWSGCSAARASWATTRSCSPPTSGPPSGASSGRGRSPRPTRWSTTSRSTACAACRTGSGAAACSTSSPRRRPASTTSSCSAR